MHFYSMNYRDTMALSISAFWCMVKNTNRIRALEDQRMFWLLQGSFAKDAEKYVQGLKNEQGDVAKTAGDNGSKLDKDGLRKLKMLMGAAKAPPHNIS